MEKIYVFGHQKPDTDAITSAISLAYLKTRLGYNCIPARLGEINRETRYVLNTFGFKTPFLLEDVKLQLKDLKYHKDYSINYHNSLKDAYNYMTERNITGVPIVDDTNKFIGLITLKTIVESIINGNVYELNTSYKNILDTLEAEEILRFDENIRGNLLAATYKSTTFMETVYLNSNNILIVGDRHSVIEYAIRNQVKMIIVVGNSEIKKEHIELARMNRVNIVRTRFDSFKTNKKIGLANYAYTVLPDSEPYTFNEEDYYDEFVVKSAKLKHNNYPILGKNSQCKGLIRITDITEKNKKKVILVDHNEKDQSVEGLEEAEILEIVDHHKLGNISTTNPINFRNMAVGSTNTIVFEMYRENNINIPANIAGIMLAGILSDTLILTSPTTTELDKYAVNALANIAQIDYHRFALNMFKVGTSLEGKTVEKIVNTDIKTFVSENIPFAISQVFTLDIDSVFSKKQEFINYINQLSRNRGYKVVLLVITDIIRNGSYLLYTTDDADIIADAFGVNEMYQGYYVDGVVSRKKQIVPKLMEVMR